ncbi:hypothetical protein F4826_004757 [Rahnella inusitata]|nr:hypothetical protein [Rahnella inusitata]
MTYFESANGLVITRKRAICEFNKHQATEEDLEEFFSGFPEDCNDFPAQDVLIFLGY